ncbi:hypothetical protein NOCA2140031 [metagenome]|uniref:Uncharacterized protein n=1 Tax=metagenome TaxID=256318 RepID=A0A2P2BWT7_9ZZZZ
MTELDDAIHTIRHKQTCVPSRRRYQRSAGAIGDTIVRCLACDSFVINGPNANNRDAATQLAAPRIVSRWRCREHTDEPVTPRGKGCRQCAKPQPIREAALHD